MQRFVSLEYDFDQLGITPGMQCMDEISDEAKFHLDSVQLQCIPKY